MGKRKHSEKKREKIARKISRLNEKLQVMAEASNSERSGLAMVIQTYLRGEEEVKATKLGEILDNNYISSVDIRNEYHKSAASDPVEEVPLIQAETNDQLEEDPSQMVNKEPLPILKEPIDEDILDALGKIEEIPKGPTAHMEISQRWTPILLKGLAKEAKLELMKKHMPFENIPISPPKLNPEIIAAVSEPVKKRDAIIVVRQKQVGAALTALGKSLQLFLEKGNTIEIIRNINDAAKIMCDTIHSDTISRRALIGSIINRDMKDSLTGEADSFLFGKDLSEKIKTTKAVQRSVKELKVTYATTKIPNKPKSLNWRGPPRPNARGHTRGRPNQPGKQQKKESRKPRPLFQNNRNIN